MSGAAFPVRHGTAFTEYSTSRSSPAYDGPGARLALLVKEDSQWRTDETMGRRRVGLDGHTLVGAEGPAARRVLEAQKRGNGRTAQACIVLVNGERLVEDVKGGRRAVPRVSTKCCSGRPDRIRWRPQSAPRRSWPYHSAVYTAACPSKLARKPWPRTLAKSTVLHHPTTPERGDDKRLHASCCCG